VIVLFNINTDTPLVTFVSVRLVLSCMLSGLRCEVGTVMYVEWTEM
jgi:hypothetical protein